MHVITSQQLYEDPKVRLPSRETVRGVKVWRAGGTQFGRAGLLGRGFDYLSFYYTAFGVMLDVALPGSVLVAMTDPPLLSTVAMRAARRRGAQLVNWLQDLYPEIAIELDVPFVKGPVAHRFYRMRDASLRVAAANVVVGQRMADRVVSRGISPDRVHVIPNWTNDQDIVPVNAGKNPLRQEWGIKERFVVGYSGNLGRAHEFDTILAASEHFRDDPEVLFLFVGSGHRIEELKRRVSERGLDRIFKFIPYQSADLLKYSLGVPDVHWISLRPEMEGLIVPSKLYGIAAAGRPIIAITDRNGEVAQAVLKNRCGFVAEPGEAAKVVAAIEQLRSDVTLREAMGKSARAMLEHEFTRKAAFDRWSRLLSEVG